LYKARHVAIVANAIDVAAVAVDVAAVDVAAVAVAVAVDVAVDVADVCGRYGGHSQLGDGLGHSLAANITKVCHIN